MRSSSWTDQAGWTRSSTVTFPNPLADGTDAGTQVGTLSRSSTKSMRSHVFHPSDKHLPHLVHLVRPLVHADEGGVARHDVVLQAQVLDQLDLSGACLPLLFHLLDHLPGEHLVQQLSGQR